MTVDRTPHVLIIDDELPICKNCIKILSGPACHAEYALNGFDALKMMEEKRFDVVITDLKMNRMGGMDVLSRIKRRFPETIVIVMTGYASVSNAVEVMKTGAFDYLPKPFTPHELRAVVRQALEQKRVQQQNQHLMLDQGAKKAVSHQLIGSSPKINKVITMIRKVAPTDATVLLYGESGTGKELVARAVHANSSRKDKVFFAVDCATLSDDLLESELFGHKKGAFTGAHQDKEGIFSLAHGGTVFLDEISNTSLAVQGKLLRFLETRDFLPIGAGRLKQVDVRLIFATNRRLDDMVLNGTFREDFYYRIFVYPINLPPLHERKTDILPISYFFLKQFSRKLGKTITGFDEKAVMGLTEFNWPGNVRQLKNAVERAVILSEGDQITLKDLPLLGEAGEIEEMIEHVPETNDELKEIKKEIRTKAIGKVEKNFLLHALAKNDWNVTQAAKTTGFQRTNFQNLMKKHHIVRPPNRRPAKSYRNSSSHKTNRNKPL